MAFVSSSTETSGNPSNGSHGLQFETLEAGSQAICEWTPSLALEQSLLPRKNGAYNSTAGKGVDILIFGGEMSVGLMADLWTIDCATMQARLIKAAGEGPTARSGARAVLVGNAYIVFGGSSFNPAKKEDASLFLLNTVTKTWSVARIAKQKPSSRTGHSFSLIGCKVFVFGGQPSSTVNTYANDLWSFDINTLFAADAQWEHIVSEDNLRPPARTNHTAVTHLGKLYIFGGTNGQQTFYDVWIFDPVLQTWTEVVVQGMIPAGRHSHSAVVVSGIMFVFGGVNESGMLMNDFVAFNISTSHWHQFDRSISFWPAARSCHAMVNVRSKIYMFGGDISHPSIDNNVVHVTDVSTMKFAVETSGISTVDSMRERLASANLYKAAPSEIVRYKGRESDTQSVRSATSRSIRSIRTDLGRDIIAALGADNAQEAIERVLSKAQCQRTPSVTAADIRVMDQYYPSRNEPKKATSSRSNSVLNYFRKRRGSHQTSKSVSGALSRDTAANKVLISKPTLRSGQPSQDVEKLLSTTQAPPNKDIGSLDFQRFLSLEREIYKKHPDCLPATDREVHPLPEMPSTIATMQNSGARSSSLAPALGRAISNASRVESIPVSITACDRERQPVLKRLGLSITDTGKNKEAHRRNISSAGTLNTSRVNDTAGATLHNSQAHKSELKAKAGEIDAGVLLNALLLLRQELSNQKKALTAEKDMALQQASEATTKANKSAQAKLDLLRKSDEQEIMAIKEQAQSLVEEDSKLKEQVRAVEHEKTVMADNFVQVQHELHENAEALKRAEVALERYVTIEAEAEELSLRQVSQTRVLEQLTIHVGAYQLRATEAEAKLEAETYRGNEAEKETLALQAQLSELELQVKHIHRLSSLAKYNWQNSAQEAETSRNVLLTGLQQLLDKENVSNSQAAPQVPSPTPLDVHNTAESKETAVPEAKEEKNAPHPVTTSKDTATMPTVSLFGAKHIALPQILEPVMQSVRAN